MSTRILHLLSQKPGWTGSGIALDAMVRAAADRDWDQYAAVGVSADDPPPVVGDLQQDRISPLVFETESLPFALPGMSDVMPYRSSRFSALTREEVGRYFAAWMDHVRRAIARFRPQIIHSHHVWVMSSLLKSLDSSIPVVTHCHGTGFRQMELCPALAEEVREGCSRNEAFVVLHRGHAVSLQRELHIDDHRISVVGSGFRQEIFHDRGRAEVGPVVTYAGKLSRAKGLPWLIKAVDKLATDRPDIVLNIAGSGSGPEADAIRRQIDRSDHVVYHGQIDQEALAALFRESAVFALPSFYEGLPLVLVEAAACGCRLVATSLPGVVEELEPQLDEVLDIVPLPRLQAVDQPVAADLPAFVDNLAAALEASLDQPAVTGASRFVAGMSWEAVFERIERLWIQLTHSTSPLVHGSIGADDPYTQS